MENHPSSCPTSAASKKQDAKKKKEMETKPVNPWVRQCQAAYERPEFDVVIIVCIIAVAAIEGFAMDKRGDQRTLRILRYL